MKQTIKRSNPRKSKRFLLLVFVMMTMLSLPLSAQDIWEPAHGPFGGSVYAITSSPNGTIYAGTLYGGVFKSTNNGNSWQPTGWTSGVFSLLAVSDTIIFMGGHSSSFYRSTDAGVTWQLKNNGLPTSSVESMVYNSSDGFIFAATSQGVYRSGDNGENWVAVNTNLTDLNVNVLLITSSNVLFAGTQTGGIFRSTSAGESWTQLTSGLPTTSVSGLAVYNNKIYAGLGSNYGVYTSSNNGDNWGNIGMTGESITSLAANANGDLFAGTWQSGIYYTSDDGSTWNAQNMGLSPLNIKTIYVDPSNDDVYAGCIWYYGAGIYYSRNDGTSWEPRNEGLNGTRIYRMATSLANNWIFAGTYYSGLYRSPDGNGWEPIGNGMSELQSSFIRALAVHPSGAIFSGSGGGGVHRSTNDGIDWMQVYPETGGYSFVGALAIREDGKIFMGESDGDGGIFISEGEGEVWQEITNGLEGKAIFSIAFNHLQHIYVGTSDNGIFRSTNDGGTWSPVGTALSTYDIVNIAVNGANHVYVTTNGHGVFKSVDNSTWTQVGTTALSDYSKPIAINGKDHIFVGSSDVMVSKDDGSTWLDYDRGLNSNEINDLTLDMEERLYAGTYDGAFKTFESTVAVRVHFSVKMKHEDGFDQDNGQVVARGYFNNWGEFDLTLVAQEDADLTYEGTALIINPGDAIREGKFEFKYAILGPDQLSTEDDIWENFPDNRSVEWDGNDDLQLEDVWFSNQREFTRMTSSVLMADTTISRGVAWGDFNGDHVEDIVVTGGGASASPNELFEGKVDGNFVRIETGPVVTDNGDSRAACWGDYDNDGHLDLFVANLFGKPNNLYHNKGDGTFDKMDIGASEDQNSVGAVWVDINNDSYIDLFVSNMNGENNLLYMNNQGTSFTKVTAGIVVSDGGDSRGCAAADFNNDGYVDLFVANGGISPGEFDYLYMNNGDSTFTKITSGPVSTEKAVSSGGSWGDFNNDGWLDLYVTHRDGQPNSLFRNENGTGFITVSETDFPADSSDSRGSAWVDFDNDGRLDLYVANAGQQKSFLYRNTGTASGFQQIESGPMIDGWDRNARGAAWGDYNSDGAPDLFVATDQGVNGLFRNNLTSNNWFKVRLIGTVSNVAALGATVVLKTSMTDNEGNKVTLRRTVEGQSGFIGQNSQTLMFGLRQESTIDSVIIYWPSGFVNKHDSKPVNQTMDFVEYEPSMAPPKVILNSPLDSAPDVSVPVTVSWNPTTGASFYQLQVGTSLDLSTGLVFDQSTLTATSHTVTELTSENTYYWRVRAGAGVWGEWSDTWKFTTGATSIEEPPPAPGLNSPANNATNVKIPPTLSWNAVSGAQKYWFQVAKSNDFTTGMMAQDSNTSSTSYTTGGGDYDTQYYWRVKARNEFGWGDWSNVWSFTTEILTGLPDAPTLVGPVDTQTGVPIPAPLVWSSVDGNYHVQIATDASFSNIVFDRGENPERYLFANEGLTYNQQYYWHVRVQVQGTYSDWSQIWRFTTFNDKVELNNVTVNFPFHERRDAFSPSDYRLVGLPGNADVAFTNVFGDGVEQDWMAYWDNGKSGSPSEYLFGYDGSGIFRFVTGKGFWVIHNGSININQSIPNAPLNDLARAEINVHQGWNIITCPFGHSINWSAIKFVNDITIANPIFRYSSDSRNFASYDKLEPMVGFYFYNGDPNRTTLLIPYIDGSGKVSTNSDLSWEVALELSSGETIDASAKIGVAADADPGLDRYEYRKPRGIADLANVYFDRAEWDENYSIFATDIRPEIDEIETWDLKVYAPVNEVSKFALIGLETIPESYEVYLIDKTHQRYQNLRENDVYEFNSTPQISDFELVVGESASVEEKIQSILPAEFALGQNYPNPFNPTTTIPLMLPEQSEVTLKVYNLLGQVVATIFKGNLEAGKHYLIWNGTNQANQKMPSGVYMYQMHTSKGLRLTGKMVLIK